MHLELHCHTVFSVDGRGTPEALVDIAAARGVTALAVTEHNHLGSLEQAQQRAAEHNILYIPGIEFDANWQGRDFHFLAYGFNPANRTLQALAQRQHQLYAHRWGLYQPALIDRGYAIDATLLVDDLAQRYPGHPQPSLNQWHAREVLVQHGLFADTADFNQTLKEIHQQLLEKHGPKSFKNFAPLAQVQKTVRAAGGVLLLAHVARYFPADAARQVALLQGLHYAGLDGFELYHPSNLAEAHFERLVFEAQSSGCLISGGSDCHHAAVPGDNPLGSVEVPDSVAQQLLDTIEQRRQEQQGSRWRRWFNLQR